MESTSKSYDDTAILCGTFTVWIVSFSAGTNENDDFTVGGSCVNANIDEDPPPDMGPCLSWLESASLKSSHDASILPIELGCACGTFLVLVCNESFSGAVGPKNDDDDGSCVNANIDEDPPPEIGLCLSLLMVSTSPT